MINNGCADRVAQQLKRHVWPQNLDPLTQPAVVKPTPPSFFLSHLADNLRKHGIVLLHRLQHIPGLFKVGTFKRIFECFVLMRLKKQRK